MADERIATSTAGDEVSWHYDIPILTNSFMLWDMFRVLALSVAIMWVLVAFMGWIVEGEPVFLPPLVLGVAFGAVSVLFVIAGALLGNRHRARFTVAGDGVGYEAEARERGMNRVVTIVGLLAGSPQTVGAGLLAQSQEQLFVPWEEIRAIRYYPRQSVISVRNSWRTVLRLHCTSELYDHVAAAVNLHWQETEVRRAGVPVERRAGSMRASLVMAGSVVVCALGAQVWYWVDDELAARIGIVAAVVLVGAVLLAGPARRILGVVAVPGLAYHAYAIGVSAADPIQGMSGAGYGFGYELDTAQLAISAGCAVALAVMALWCVFGRQRDVRDASAVDEIG